MANALPTTATPPRVTFQNLANGVTMNAQYNPASFEEDIGAVYQKIKIQGLSHQVLQFEHTENYTAKFDLTFDQFSTGLARGLSDNIMTARNNILSWVYPTRAGSGSVASGGPGRIMFVWPLMVSLTGVITKLTFKNKRFAWGGVDPTTQTGAQQNTGSLVATWFTVSVTLEAIRDTPIYADQIAASGTVWSGT
jgi:hypothetical protein